MTSPIPRAVRIWNRFWFRPVDDRPMTVVRIGYGLILLWWTITLLPDYDTILGSPSARGPLVVGSARVFAVFRWTQSPLVVALVTAGIGVAAVLLIVGRWTRPAAIVAGICFPSLVQAVRPFSNGQETVLIAWTMFMVIIAIAAPEALAGRLRRPAAAVPADAATADAMPAWPLRLFQIQVTAGYLFAVLDKLHGVSWRGGYAVYYALNNLNLASDTVPLWLIESRSMMAAATWGTLALEATLPILLWWTRTRLVGVVAAIAMHHAFGFFIELGFFTWVMTLGLLAFVSWERTPLRRPSVAT